MTLPLASVTLPLTAAVALLLTCTLTGAPGNTLRLPSSAVTVAVTVSAPVLTIVGELSTTTRSLATTTGPGGATTNATVRVIAPLMAVTVMVRLLRSEPMPMVATALPELSVLLALRVAVAPLLTWTVTGAPGRALRFASSAVIVAVMVSAPVFAMLAPLNTSTKSAAVTTGPGGDTCRLAVRVMVPLVAVTVMVRLLRSAPMPMVAVVLPEPSVLVALRVAVALLLT